MQDAITETKYIEALDSFSFMTYSVNNQKEKSEFIISAYRFKEMVDELYKKRNDYIAKINKNNEESKKRAENLDKLLTNIEKLTDQVMALTTVIANLEPRIKKLEDEKKQ